MRRPINLLILVLLLASAHCARRPTNVESALVDQVIGEFAVERYAWYLRGGEPRSNREILEKVLSRHSLRYNEFAAPFRRFQPEIFGRVIGNQPSR